MPDKGSLTQNSRIFLESESFIKDIKAEYYDFHFSSESYSANSENYQQLQFISEDLVFILFCQANLEAKLIKWERSSI